MERFDYSTEEPPEVEPCTRCGGDGKYGAWQCKRCAGSGDEPPPEPVVSTPGVALPFAWPAVEPHPDDELF